MGNALTASAAEQALSVTDLEFSYPRSSLRLRVERFVLDRGQSSAVIGPSGCGKTTFVQLLAGLLTPASGNIQVLGHNLAEFSEVARDRFRGRHIGFVFQRFHLLRALTVRQNVALAMRLAGKEALRRETAQRVDAVLEDLSLSEFGDRRPDTLSQGQAQRVAIARALIHEPALLIADEPTSALDDRHAEETLALLLRAAEASRAALLIVTHDQRLRGRLGGEFPLDTAL